MLPDCGNDITKTKSENDKTKLFSKDGSPPLPSQKCPSADFSSHFVIKSGGSGSSTKIGSDDKVCEDNSIKTELASSKEFTTPSVTASEPGQPTTTPATPSSSSSPSSSLLFRTPSLPASSSLQHGDGPLAFRRSSQQRHQHPFMMTPDNRKSFASAGHLLDTPPSRATSLFAMPDSPMDSTYQPISQCCLRKNKMGEYQPDEPNDRGGVELEEDSDYQKILKACGQREPIPIDLIFNGLKDISKIGEGVYGEVYSGTFRYFTQYSWVYKVVAIAGDKTVNGERQKSFAEVLPEILVSQELSNLKGVMNNCYTDGYAFMKNARIARGRYPTCLIEPWEKFNEKYESDNDKPDFFAADQLYMVLEFKYAGEDIESLNFRDARQTFSIVLQVAHILAVGEAALEFEHRDLHWGNILVQTWTPPKVRYLINGETIYVPSFGIKAAVIDFTISRVKHPKSQSVICLDLEDDEEQFLGTGDHQFDIYRMMRDYNRNDWQKYCPKSNVFWLHYLANKLYVKGHYSLTPNRVNLKSRVTHVRAVRKLREFSNLIMDFDSATDFVRSEQCLAYRQFLAFHEDAQERPATSPQPVSASESKTFTPSSSTEISI